MPTRRDLILKLTALLLFLLCDQVKAQKGGYFKFGVNLEPRVFVSDQTPFEYIPLPIPSPTIGYGRCFELNNSSYKEISTGRLSAAVTLLLPK